MFTLEEKAESELCRVSRTGGMQRKGNVEFTNGITTIALSNITYGCLLNSNPSLVLGVVFSAIGMASAVRDFYKNYLE